MIKINVRPIEAFEVTDENGRAVAVVRVAERWQGMARLATDDGQSLIVEDLNTFAAQFGSTFARVFEGKKDPCFSLQVYRASPELIAKLGLSAPSA